MKDIEIDWIDKEYEQEMMDVQTMDEEMELEILEEMAEYNFEGATLERTLAQIRAVRSFFAQGNSATFLKSLSEDQTLLNLSKQKSVLQQSLARFNPPSLASDT